MFYDHTKGSDPKRKDYLSLFLGLAGVALVLALSSTAWAQGMTGGSAGMKGMGAARPDVPRVPPVKGFSEGQQIFFIHTEASDAGVAKILTDMMGSPVLVVPSLADAPESMLANVYAFKNGLQQGEGPFGFTPDVFDHPPGNMGYSPLRRLNLVYWEDEKRARVLKSAAEVIDAQRAGDLRIESTGIVVNMPLLTWPGGER